MNEPLVNVRIGPCLPEGIGDDHIVFLHLREELVTGNSSKLDDATIVAPPKCIIRPNQLTKRRTPLTQSRRSLVFRDAHSVLSRLRQDAADFDA